VEYGGNPRPARLSILVASRPPADAFPHGDYEFDLDRHAARQLGGPDGGTGMSTILPEKLQ
jgi:hypothetical protein